MTSQWHLLRARSDTLAPFMGCFRYQSEALRLFRTSSQPSLGAPWPDTISPNISVPTDGPVWVVKLKYEHGVAFQMPVKLNWAGSDGQATGVAIYDIGQAIVAYRSYLTFQGPAALEQAVKQSFPSPDMSSEVVSSVYGAALSYYRSLQPSPEWDPFARHGQTELRDADPGSIMNTGLTLWLALS